MFLSGEPFLIEIKSNSATNFFSNNQFFSYLKWHCFLILKSSSLNFFSFKFCFVFCFVICAFSGSSYWRVWSTVQRVSITFCLQYIVILKNDMYCIWACCAICLFNNKSNLCLPIQTAIFFFPYEFVVKCYQTKVMMVSHKRYSFNSFMRLVSHIKLRLLILEVQWYMEEAYSIFIASF